MMLVGIGGCTALLLTGFGIRDSIVDIVDYQFSEIVLYDLEVHFSEGLSEANGQDFAAAAAPYAQDLLIYHQSNVEIDGKEGTREVSMIVSDNRIEQFLNLHSGQQKLSYPQNGEILVSKGVALNIGIEAGDTVTLRTGDMQRVAVRVADVFDNYISNFVLLTQDTAAELLGETAQQQTACVMLKDGVDHHEAAAKLSERSDVLNISINQDLANQVGSMLEALDLVVLTIVVCAGLLAVIVLYNLTNINITERIREIATIKVLGFRSRESAAYVFKENLLLTTMGAVLGLPAGLLLLNFVMGKIRIDMIWMPARLSFQSYILAILLTMLSALLVDFALYFKLEKVNMAEALKSVE